MFQKFAPIFLVLVLQTFCEYAPSKTEAVTVSLWYDNLTKFDFVHQYTTQGDTANNKLTNQYNIHET